MDVRFSMMSNFLKFLIKFFKYIIVLDFEFVQEKGSGENPKLVCLVVKEIITQKTHRFWLLDKKKIKFPYPIQDSLFIGHYLVAEVACMLELGLEKPKHLWDTFIENKKLYNGKIKQGFGLEDCCARYKIDYPLDKEQYRKLIIGNYPHYSRSQEIDILEYCETDVTTNEQLFLKQLQHLEVLQQLKTNKDFARVASQAKFHGRAMAITAQIEKNGIPIDENLYNDFNKHFPEIKRNTIEEINKKYDLYKDGVFKKDKFAAFLKKFNLHNRWPKTPTGKFKEDDKTFSRFSKFIPEIDEIKSAFFITNAMKLKGYAVGKDKRSRTALNMMGQKTGRTNVSTAFNPFGAPRYARTMIHPDNDSVLVYADWKSQEPFIQAHLSGDQKMKDALATKDVYLATSKLCKAVPETATKKSHPKEREIYKVSFLAINYGQEAESLSAKLGIPLYLGRSIHQKIKKVYEVYNNWSDGWVAKGMQRGFFKTMYGWKYHLTFKEAANPRSIKNWPIQSHGSEMIRHAIAAADDAGFEISMCVHDALLVHIKKKGWARNILKLVKVMEAASEKIIGVKIPVEIKVIRKHFYQEGSDGEKWNKLYKKYLEAKNKVYQKHTPIDNDRCTKKITGYYQNFTPVPVTNKVYKYIYSRGRADYD